VLFPRFFFLNSAFRFVAGFRSLPLAKTATCNIFMYMMKPLESLKIFACAAFAVLVLAGCGDGAVDNKPPPLGGLRLVTRMLTNLEERDFATAARQYHKLTAGSSGQLDVTSILFEQTIEANRVTTAVAEKLDAGDLPAAVLIARDAKRLNPLNQGIEETFSAVNSLQELSDCARDVRAAKNSLQLSAALSRRSMIRAS